ncbi:MAG TPA: alpha-2-macroglobulin, partial [Acidobacteriota bacterium]
MKKHLIAFFTLLGVTVLLAQPSDYESLQAEAEKYYVERSYSRAHEVYQKLEGMPLTSEQTRWVAFRLADTQWRSQAATETADPTKFEKAQHSLEVLVRDAARPEDRDRIWAEVQESLGDFFWTRNDVRNWGQAWTYYERALDWWAGSDDMENARKRYLNIVWRASKPHWAEPYYYYGYYGNYVPLSILDNALKIANAANDKDHAHYLTAMTSLHQGGDLMQRQRIEKEFTAALSAGKTTDWHDDALYFYAERLATQGRFVQTEDGQWRSDPDFVKALELFRKLTTEYAKGETQYYDQAKEQIKNITRPA